MLNWIARQYSSLASLLTAPLRAVWRVICRLYPARDITMISGGDLVSYHQTSFWRFARSVGKIVLVIWALWATYVFVYHRPLLQRRTRQLDAAKLQHSQQMSDLRSFYTRYADLHKEINSIDDKLVNDKKLKDPQKADLLKKRVNAWAQIEMIGTRIGNMMTDSEYAPEIKKLSDMSVEYELLREDNRVLRDENKKLMESMLEIGDASNQIYNRVSKLTDDNLKDVNKNMGKIRGSLASLGFNDRVLISRASSANNSVIGDAVFPITFGENVPEKYRELSEKLDRWSGLARALNILPLGAPVDRAIITSRYGDREHPLDGKIKPHKGVDFKGKVGTPLYAVAPGKVVFVGSKSGYGRVVEIEHSLGFSTLYAHLDSFNVARGDIVRARDVIGLGGNSGKTTGPHLHYEVRYKDQPFNPYSFIKGE